VIKLLQDGALPKPTAKRTLKVVNQNFTPPFNLLKLLAILQTNIPAEFFKAAPITSSAQTTGPREVILSEYLVKS